jgi:hypothetical protein
MQNRASGPMFGDHAWEPRCAAVRCLQPRGARPVQSATNRIQLVLFASRVRHLDPTQDPRSSNTRWATNQVLPVTPMSDGCFMASAQPIAEPNRKQHLHTQGLTCGCRIEQAHQFLGQRPADRDASVGDDPVRQQPQLRVAIGQPLHRLQWEQNYEENACIGSTKEWTDRQGGETDTRTNGRTDKGVDGQTRNFQWTSKGMDGRTDKGFRWSMEG